MTQVSGVAALLFLVLSIAGPVAAGAAEQTGVPAGESAWRLGAALGYGERTNPLIQSEDVPILVDLDVAWFGERFFFDNGDFGFTLADNDLLTANVVGRFNSDRVFFGRTDTKFFRLELGTGGSIYVETAGPGPGVVEVTVPDRDYAIELGFELLADGRWGMLQLTGHHDVGGTHGGYELFVDYGYGWRRQRWYLEPSFGFAWKSSDMNDYYWGVNAGEANELLPAYRAGSGTDAHARLLASYQLTRHWTFSTAAELVRLNGGAAGSPIVAERNVVGWFAGFGYRFR